MSALPDRVPVRGDGPYWLRAGHPDRVDGRVHAHGTVSREEHLLAWKAYARRYGSGQSARRIYEASSDRGKA